MYRANEDDLEFEAFYVRPTNERAEFYLNQDTAPVLVVEDMKHGIGAKGSLGIFVDIGTEAFVSELKVVCTD